MNMSVELETKGVQKIGLGGDLKVLVRELLGKKVPCNQFNRDQGHHRADARTAKNAMRGNSVKDLAYH